MVKLTPAEKAALKEQKRREQLLAAEEAARQVRRDELSREMQYGRLTREKLEESWVKLLTDIKIPVLKTELQYTINDADRVLDIKDFLISLLVDELTYAEFQYAHNFRTYCENAQKVYLMYCDRINELKSQYLEEHAQLQHRLLKQRARIQKQSETEEKNLKTMIFGLATLNKKLQTSDKVYYLSKNKEMVSKYEHIASGKRYSIEETFERIWADINSTFEQFDVLTKDIINEYEERRLKNDTVLNIIVTQGQDVFNSQRILRITREIKEIQKETFIAKISSLEKELYFLLKITHALSNTLQADVKLDEKLLTYLVVESNSNIKKLEEIKNFAEKILTIYSIVKKYETQREKILPFPIMEGKKYSQNYMWGELKHLVPFWQKCAQANTTIISINSELHFLQKDNKNLKRTIKEFLSSNVRSPHITLNVLHPAPLLTHKRII